jgi:uncharacterized Tic20 family protein
MASSPQIPHTPQFYVPTKDDRTFAMLAHVLQLFGAFIAPLVIYVAKRDSPFVRFHALQALIWKIAEMVLIFGVIIVFIVAMFSTIAVQGGTGAKEPPLAVFLLFPLIWGGVLLTWIVNITIAIYFGIKAYDGEWAAYPFIGRLARKWAGV